MRRAPGAAPRVSASSPRVAASRAVEPGDPGLARPEIALELPDRHVAPADLLHRAGLGREAALGLLLHGADAQGEFGPQMIAVGRDFGKRQRERSLGPLARQPSARRAKAGTAASASSVAAESRARRA
jgi:hypothetical protein